MLEAALDNVGWIGGAKVHGTVGFRLEIRQVFKTMLFNTDALLIELLLEDCWDADEINVMSPGRRGPLINALRRQRGGP
jgi:hypothetical protein